MVDLSDGVGVEEEKGDMGCSCWSRDDRKGNHY